MSHSARAIVPFRMSGREVALLLREAGHDVIRQIFDESEFMDTRGTPQWLSDIIVFHPKGETSKYSMSVISESCLTNAGDTGHEGEGTQIRLSGMTGAADLVRDLMSRTGGWINENPRNDAAIDDGWKAILPVAERTPEQVHHDRLTLVASEVLAAIHNVSGKLGLEVGESSDGDAPPLLVNDVVRFLREYMVLPDGYHEKTVPGTHGMR